MKDQINGLRRKGIKATGLYSGQYKREQDIILDNAVYDKDMKFLFVSPERLKSPIFKARVVKMPINLIAIDEAHCISEWGHDFRPEYRNIALVKELVQDVPMIALTATATPDVREDIVNNLLLDNPVVFTSSPVRENLSYNILYSESKKEILKQYILQGTGSQIVYSTTRKGVMQIQKNFTEAGIKSMAFHGGMNKKDRDKCIVAWDKNEVKVIVATKAFGMGIDKSDVRQVIHVSPPQSLEAYVQEAGRAGRDGEPAQVIILYNQGDIKRLQRQLAETFPDIDYIKEMYRNICLDYKLATGKCDIEFYPFYVGEFCSKHSLSRYKVFSALKILHQSEILFLSDAITHPSRLQLNEIETKHILSHPNLSPKMAEFIKLLLRNYEGLFLDHTVIDEKLLSIKFNKPISTISKALKWIHDKKIGEYKSNFEGHTISFMEYRHRSSELPIKMELYNLSLIHI